MDIRKIAPWDDTCPAYRLFSLLGKKWSIYILLCISENTNTFNAILKRLPKINSKVLAEGLDLLVENGFILREVSTEKPLKVIYKLAAKGEELTKILDEMAEWAIEQEEKYKI